jgi:hypothetical protein
VASTTLLAHSPVSLASFPFREASATSIGVQAEGAPFRSLRHPGGRLKRGNMTLSALEAPLAGAGRLRSASEAERKEASRLGVV